MLCDKRSVIPSKQIVYRTAIPLLRVKLQDQHLRCQNPQGGCSSSLAKARCDWRFRRRCFVLAWVAPSATFAASLGLERERCPQASIGGDYALSQNRPSGIDLVSTVFLAGGAATISRDKRRTFGTRGREVATRCREQSHLQETSSKMDRPPRLRRTRRGGSNAGELAEFGLWFEESKSAGRCKPCLSSHLPVLVFRLKTWSLRVITFYLLCMSSRLISSLFYALSVGFGHEGSSGLENAIRLVQRPILHFFHPAHSGIS